MRSRGFAHGAAGLAVGPSAGRPVARSPGRRVARSPGRQVAWSPGLSSGPSRGFSLLEVIVAIGIVTVGVTAVLALFAAGVDTHKRSIDQSNASLAAQSLTAELEAKYTVARIDAWKAKQVKQGKKKVEDREYLQDIPAKGAEYPEIPGFPGYLYGVKFTRLDPEGNAVLARIEILWRRGGGAPATEEFPVVLLKRPY